MRARAKRVVVFGIVAGVQLAAVSHAQADVFGPISLASQSTTAQVEDAHDPAISGNGRYVAFDGSYAGVTGVWRRDLATGAIAQVAAGDAELPSISGNGEFVSFTTTSRLAPQDDNNGPDVYVRDMDEEATQEGAYTLASAVTVEGTSKGLTYAYPGGAFDESHFGAVAAGRSALSEDGHKVVFVTTAPSDLTDPQTPSEPTTPPMQVVMRNLETNETRLVSTRMGTSDEPVVTQEETAVYGAVFTGVAGAAPAYTQPPAYGSYIVPPLGASISADGSTVAWMGVNIGQQAPLLGGEVRSPTYTEPLWRRIAPGSETPTERITGGSDPSDPACVASGELSLGGTLAPLDPCQGPFATPEIPPPSGIWASGGPGDFVPRLSSDGYTVAFLARAQLASLGETLGISQDGGPADLYVADMRPGLTRDAALRRLTQLASSNTSDVATTAAVLDFGVSSNGSQVAFTTARTQFILGSPAYVTAPAAEAGMSELFDADLGDDTLTRVTHGYEGGPAEHTHPGLQAGRDPYPEGDGALSPSFSTDGRELAFASTASNLVYGDGNSPPSFNPTSSSFDGSDAFVVERQVFGAATSQQYVSPAPSGPAVGPAWRLGATARGQRDGSVLLYVRVPGAGRLNVGAQGAVRVRRAVVASRPGKGRRGRAGSSGRRFATGVSTRTVATRSARPVREGLLTLTLKLAKRYSALANPRGGLSATVKLSFSAPGHATLKESIQVIFARAEKRAKTVTGRKGRASEARAGTLGTEASR